MYANAGAPIDGSQLDNFRRVEAEHAAGLQR